MMQPSIIIVIVSPGHRTVVWGGGDAGVRVVHVIEYVTRRLHPRVVADRIAHRVAVGHALARAPRAISYVRGKAGYVLCLSRARPLIITGAESARGKIS